MAREIMVIEAPIQEPHICAKCSVGAGDRPYFVDLGIDNEMVIQNAETKLPHYTIGCIYFCSECFENAFASFNRLVFKFLQARINSNLNEAKKQNSALEIQMQENKFLKDQLDNVHEELRAAKGLLRKQVEEELYGEGKEPSGETVLDTLLGVEDGNGSEGDSKPPAGINIDFEAGNSGSESNDSNNESLPVAPAITLTGFGQSD